MLRKIDYYQPVHNHKCVGTRTIETCIYYLLSIPNNISSDTQYFKKFLGFCFGNF